MKLQRADYKQIIKDYPHVRDKAQGDFLINPCGDLAASASESSKRLPEWSLVQISITLPLGHDMYCDSKGDYVSEPLWETPKDGAGGRRYKGIGLLETLGAKSAKGLHQMYYISSKGRFGADIAVAMGEEVQAEESCLSSYVWLSPVSPYNNSSEEEPLGAERCRFELEPEDGVVGVPSVELVSFELLQYRDRVTNVSGYQRYLVLHFIASDCTSAQLEKVSQSLTKPRNKCVGKNGEEFSVGQESVRFICEKLNSGISGSYHFEFVAGGFLKKPKSAKRCKCAGKGASLVNILNSPYPKPARSVCAIPNIPFGEIDYTPKVFEEFGPEAVDEKTKGLLWAAQLARGFDQYSEEIPTLDALQSSQPVDFQLKNWSLLVEDSCIVAVRKVPELHEDSNIITLAPTRYVDLLLLVQRSYLALRVLGEQLRNIDSQVEIINDFRSEDERHRYNIDLRQQFKQLLMVQNRFSSLRKNLWFNAIPRRQLDTQILLQLRQGTGVQNLYDDLVDEVRFRHRIHDMTYHEFDAELKDKERIRREEEADERRKRLEQEDASREEIARRQEKFATILSIIGFIAIPLPLLNDGLAVVKDIIGDPGYDWSYVYKFPLGLILSVVLLGALTWVLHKYLGPYINRWFGISPYDPRSQRQARRRSGNR